MSLATLRDMLIERAKLLRPKGSGTVEKTADGFRARLPGLRTIVAKTLTREDAAAALDRAIARLGLAAPGAAPLVTLAEHARQVCARRVAEGHRNARNELLSVELHIAGDPIGRMPLGLVDRTHARAWLGRMVCKVSTKTRRPLATQTIRNALNLARVLVAAAVVLIGTSP